MRAFFLLVLFPSLLLRADDRIRVVSDCSEPDRSVAEITATDKVTVLSGMATGSGMCYSVQAISGDHTVEGFIVGASHPAIQAYEEQRRKVAAAEVAVSRPAPVPTRTFVPGTAKAASVPQVTQAAPPPLPARFPVLEGFDPNRFQTVRSTALDGWAYLVVFWSPSDPNSKSFVQGRVNDLNDQFHYRGLEVITIAPGVSQQALRRSGHDLEMTWPNIADEHGYAKRLGVTQYPTTFLLDRNFRVVGRDLQGLALDQALKKTIGRGRPQQDPEHD